MSFAAAFRDLVQPRLERECFVAGTQIALGLAGFAESAGAIRVLAHTLGASRLPAHLHEATIDWIDARLLHHTLAAETAYAAACEMIERVTAPEGGPECPTTSNP